MIITLMSIFESLQRRRLAAGGVRSVWADTSAGRVHALDWRGGDGPTVLLIHGIGASSLHFGLVLRELRGAAGRVVALDLPGHGLSDAPAAATDGLRAATLEAISAMVPERAFVVGNSLGGLVAVRYALAAPEKIAGLILVSPAGAPMPAADLRALLQPFRVDNNHQAREFVDRLYARRPWFAPAAAPFVRASFSRPYFRRLLDEIAPSDLLGASELGQITAPTMLLWGDLDRILLRDNRDFFESHLPQGAERRRPPGYGHCPQLEVPHALAGDIVEFISRHPRSCSVSSGGM